ncbi:hypothetical protein C922_03613 [Plasmodium inui San Antonio 1]|uniref:Uncharacterized protein n=1 Tax=Plasmodium inui San Antonio 1 TaxID=1237626 RepID=W7A9R7_9APIC|nr:hypothetical protein C922_03613 [Plasmodium inui San Antonio 1]EUD65889.1 hypothetical protein C922_03613 [Plasmodium inui San Antonio 1]
MDEEQNEHANEKELQTFLNEIEDLVNEAEVKTDFNEAEELMRNTCKQLIEKKKKNSSCPIDQKIKLFLEEVNFINYTLDEYAKESQRREQISDRSKEQIGELPSQGENLPSKEQDEMLKDLVFLELGLKETSPAVGEAKELLLTISENFEKIENKEFVLTTKKALDIRIDDFRRNEISADYFSKRISQIHADTVNQLARELEEKEKNSTTMCRENTSKEGPENNPHGELPRLNLTLVSSMEPSAGEAATEGGELSNAAFSQNDKSEEGKCEAHTSNSGGNSTQRRSRNEKIMVHSNFFHKKKMKLMERWQKVAEESKLRNDSDSSC